MLDLSPTWRLRSTWTQIMTRVEALERLVGENI